MDHLELKGHIFSEIQREYQEMGADGKEIQNDVTKGD